VRLRFLPALDYAESGGGPPRGVRPVFASLLLRDPPRGAARARQASALTRAIAQACGRPVENTHLLYRAPARGRAAFGGRILALVGAALGGLLTVPAARAEEPVRIVLSDVTAEALAGETPGGHLSFGDFDGDGDADLTADGARLYRNDTVPGGPIRLVDITAESGIAAGPGGAGIWVDLDGDGRLDVVTTGGAFKRQHEPGRFRDEAKERGLDLERASSSVGAGDIDGDGRPELLFGGGEDWNDGNPRYFGRRLFTHRGSKRLKDATDRHDLGGGRYGRSVVFADYDRDGDLDAYLGNYRLQANELLENREGRLVNRAEAAGVAGRFGGVLGKHPTTGEEIGLHYGHTIASAWSDLDGDGDLDLWVSNLVHKFVGAHESFPGGFDTRGWICDDSAIYRNEGPPEWKFTDARPESGIPTRPIGDRGVFRGDELWSHAACGDLDGDGLPEVFVAQVYQLDYSHCLLFRNLGGMRFAEVSGEVGIRRFNHYGGALADLDGDGDLDLACDGAREPAGPGRLWIFRNDTEPGPWVAFRLRGPGSGTQALGAQVIVSTDRGDLVRQVEAGTGSHGQSNESVLRFGLRGRTLRGAKVVWPGGRSRDLDMPALGRVHGVVP
jgi:hypothetical protein